MCGHRVWAGRGCGDTALLLERCRVSRTCRGRPVATEPSEERSYSALSRGGSRSRVAGTPRAPGRACIDRFIASDNMLYGVPFMAEYTHSTVYDVDEDTTATSVFLLLLGPHAPNAEGHRLSRSTRQHARSKSSSARPQRLNPMDAATARRSGADTRQRMRLSALASLARSRNARTRSVSRGQSRAACSRNEHRQMRLPRVPRQNRCAKHATTTAQPMMPP